MLQLPIEQRAGKPRKPIPDSANPLDRLNAGIKRRTNVVGVRRAIRPPEDPLCGLSNRAGCGARMGDQDAAEALPRPRRLEDGAVGPGPVGRSDGSSPRPPVAHKLDPCKGIIDARLEAFPELSARRLFDEVRAAGYAGCYESVRNYVRGARPPRAGRAGGAAGPGRLRNLHAFLGPAPCPGGRAGYSRLLWLSFFPRQTMAMLMEALESAFETFGGVPEDAVRSDARRRAVRRPRRRGRPSVQRGVPALRLPTLTNVSGDSHPTQPPILSKVDAMEQATRPLQDRRRQTPAALRRACRTPCLLCVKLGGYSRDTPHVAKQVHGGAVPQGMGRGASPACIPATGSLTARQPGCEPGDRRSCHG